MIHVVGEDVQGDVCGGFHNFAIGHAGGAGRLERNVADFAALHYDAAREFQNRVGLVRCSRGMARVGDVLVSEPGLATEQSVRT